MKATIGHIGINLSNDEASFAFWQDLLRLLGFELTLDGNHFDASDGRTYLCVSTTKSAHVQSSYHRKQTGLNHVAFSVSSPDDVDAFVSEFLGARGIEPLYGGAKSYPEYADGYYAVYFEDPDRIKIEVVYDPAVVAI